VTVAAAAIGGEAPPDRPLTEPLADPVADPLDGPLAGPPTGTGPDVPAGELTVLMEAVRDSAARLLSGLAHPPTALRLRVGAVEMALEWQPGSPVTAPAAVAVVDTSAAGVFAGAVPAATAGAPSGPAGAAVPLAPSARIDAPTVGVFYHAPEPGAAPFVRVGDVVAPGRQVGIVEVMKLMIPVEADRAGRITGVLVGNGDQVEYGDPLFSLEPVAADGR
jgi:acetyl-CoA carboxylase biotin carboxyl carrier protein